MIRITIELMPTRKDEPIRTLGVGFIAPDGATMNNRSNYDVRLMRESEKGKFERVWRRGTIKHFPRLDRTVWDLALSALFALLGDRLDQETEHKLIETIR
jgi:hypothetical protein